MSKCDWGIWRWKRRQADKRLKAKLRKCGMAAAVLTLAIIGLG